jgi:hypothetical protein
MIRVYAPGKSTVFGRKQQVFDRRTSPAERDLRQLKISAGVVGLVAVMTVLVSFFMGQAINSQQSELNRARSMQSDLQQANNTLLAERNSMLLENRIAMSAAKLGLFPSPGNQTRKVL